jgi:hypothetical protein
MLGCELVDLTDTVGVRLLCVVLRIARVAEVLVDVAGAGPGAVSLAQRDTNEDGVGVGGPCFGSCRRGLSRCAARRNSALNKRQISLGGRRRLDALLRCGDAARRSRRVEGLADERKGGVGAVRVVGIDLEVGAIEAAPDVFCRRASGPYI